MASIIAENWEYVDACDDLKTLELSHLNHNLLMSLLDETQLLDDCDDERVEEVVRSLEAELDSGIDHYAFGEGMGEINLMDYQSSNDGSSDRDCLMMHDNLDLHWANMEIMPYSIEGMYMDHNGQGMDGVNDFGWIKNYYSHLCYETPLEEQDYDSLWYNTNADVIE